MKVCAWLLAIVIIWYMASSPSVWASTFCEDFADPEKPIRSDALAISEVCTSEVDSFNGTFAFIEKGFLPIPKQFYLKLPHEDYISMDSALMANGRFGWPYGVLIISGLERSQIQNANEKNKITHSVIKEFRKACQIPLNVWRLRFEMPGSKYAPYFIEAQLGQTRISLAGETSDLMLAMLDSFRRLNCKIQNTEHKLN